MHRFATLMLAGLGCAAVLLSSAALGIAAVIALGLLARRHAHAGLTLLLVATMGCAGVVTTDPSLRGVAVRPLGFKGRLADGARVELPTLLTIMRHDREIGRYRAEAKASQTHGLYYGADVLALETQARTAVRRVIDEALSGDAARLTPRVDSLQP